MSPAEEEQPTKADEILRGLEETRKDLKGQGERLDAMSETLKSLQKPPQAPPSQQETPSHMPFDRYLDEHVLGDKGCPTCKKALKDRKGVISALFSEGQAPPEKPTEAPPEKPAQAPPEKPTEAPPPTEDKTWGPSRLFSKRGEAE